MARIKIKSGSSKDPDRLNQLLELLSKNDIYATKILPAPDGFVVVTENEAELDRIFNNTTDKELINNQFTPLIPPELKAHRSVLIFRIDDHIYNNNEESILQELQEQNQWITGIASVSKFTRGRGLKITFTDTIVAKKAQEKGLLLYSMRIPSYNIIQDRYLSINTCLRCYKLEDHYTANCPKTRDYKICSDCSEEGHTWKECDGRPKRCINCEGNHSTMVMGCKKKKEILNTKRREGRENTIPYAETLKKPTVINQIQLPTASTHVTIIQCMYQAHMENITNPGSYEKTVNIMFAANNLPPLKVPFVPNSELLITKLTDAMNNSTGGVKTQPTSRQDQQETAQAQASAVEQIQEHQIESEMETDAGKRSEQHRCKKQERKEKRKSLTKIKGTEVGLQILTAKSTGWPEVPPRKQSLVKGIEEKSIKWTYTDPTFKEKEVWEKFVFGMIDLTDCLYMIDDDMFRKVKSGLIEERSPPPRQSKARKDSV